MLGIRVGTRKWRSLEIKERDSANQRLKRWAMIDESDHFFSLVPIGLISVRHIRVVASWIFDANLTLGKICGWFIFWFGNFCDNICRWLILLVFDHDAENQPFFVLKSFSSIFSLPHIGRTCGPIWYIPPRSLCQTETVFKEINAEERYLIMVTKNVVLCLHPDPNSFSMLSPCLSLSRTLSYHMTSCFETAPL